MASSRSMRYLLATQCRVFPWHMQYNTSRNSALLQQTATNWYVKTPAPATMAATHYSTSPKDVLNSFVVMTKRLDSTAAAKPKITTNLEPEHKPITTPPLTINNPTVEIPSIMPSKPPSTSPAPSPSPSPPPPIPIPFPNPTNVDSQSNSDKSPKETKSPEIQAKAKLSMPPSRPPSSDSRLQPPNFKMPSREQLEKYFFTALVYVWDFCYYVFCLSLRLIDTYVLKNPTLQENWKKLMKRLDEQRQAIKSKK